MEKCIEEKIIKLISNKDFDEKTARNLLEGVDVNCPIFSNKSTFLNVAVQYNNPKAVKLLLELGADPNFGVNDEYPLWNLQYLDGDLEDRCEIQKLFFKYGANPNFIWEDESLYDYVVYKVYNDYFYTGDDFLNLVHFYKLLVINGGGGIGYRKPDVTKVDPSRPDDYDVEFEYVDGGRYIKGTLIDEDGEVVALL